MAKSATTTGLILSGGTGMAGLVTASDDPDEARASATFATQTTAGTSAIVESASLEIPGYVTIHESRLLEGVAAPSIVGVTGYLEAGDYENLVVPFTRIEGNPIEPDGDEEVTHTLIAVPHYENSDPPNQEFNFHGSPDDPDADLADLAFTNGPKEADGLPNDGVNDLADVTFLSRVGRDEISEAKYGLSFSELSEETAVEVEEICDRQPFAGTLAVADIRTRDEIAQVERDMPFDELSDETKATVEMLYDGQFIPARAT